ncbi:MAG TPA: chloride channel protein [Longimicrobiaceae bacterium]|nr:chloride channel protein [Longimicrobiaceae bacterium]
MASDRVRHREADEALPIAPSMEPALESVRGPREGSPIGGRVIYISFLATVIAAAAAVIAFLLLRLIWLITNLTFHGRFSFEHATPLGTELGPFVMLVPILGAVVIGLMARYGSPAIRGHGIPEVMERVLYNKSRISPRVMFLKPLSAAIAIGTGGPFGAEGPIIATGGALGSVVGQFLRITADERKVLLTAGAAAGMTATFGTPVSAVLLAIELLLFEYRARSIIPIALASATATAVRIPLMGAGPIFDIPPLAQPTLTALMSYAVLGVIIGVLSVFVTRVVYAIEDGFEKLPVHWMWWPALGAVVVGIVGYIEPRTLGVGYYNIEEILSGELVGTALAMLIFLKFVSWAVYLGSGTSGGTLAPLFTIGGGVGAGLGALAGLFPALGVTVPISALVGMAAIFAGASHALLASAVFAFETTRQPISLLPLLVGCTNAFLVSQLMMKHSIMTERLARRGVSVRTDYAVDHLSQVLVRDVASRDVVTIKGDDTLEVVRRWLAEGAEGTDHQGFPVLGPEGYMIGVVTRRDILNSTHPDTTLVKEVIGRPPAVIYETNTLRQAADHMVRSKVGRLPVVHRDEPRTVLGMLTRSDLLTAHQTRLDDEYQREKPNRTGILGWEARGID